MGKDHEKGKAIEIFPNGCYPGEKNCKYDQYGHLKREFRHQAPDAHKKPHAPQHEEKKQRKPDKKIKVEPELIV